MGSTALLYFYIMNKKTFKNILLSTLISMVLFSCAKRKINRCNDCPSFHKNQQNRGPYN